MLRNLFLAALLAMVGAQAFALELTPTVAESGNYNMLMAGIGLIGAIAVRRSSR